MASSAADLAIIEISTHAVPERERVGYWREVVGRRLLRLDVEPLPDRVFQSRIVARLLPGLAISYPTMIGGLRSARTPELHADGNDDLLLLLPEAGDGIASMRGSEIALGPGDALLLTCSDRGTITVPNELQFTQLQLPRSALAPLVPRLDDAITQPIPRGSEVLRLLKRYVRLVGEGNGLSSPELRRLAVTHVHDLVALVAGATRDGVALVQGRGLRAARLREALSAIEAGFADPAFSPDDIARRFGVSPRYVQDLLHETGLSFTARVLELRLQRARAMLAEPRHDRLKVAEIADACGFNEIPYFNRCFRRRFGAPPTQFRGAVTR